MMAPKTEAVALVVMAFGWEAMIDIRPESPAEIRFVWEKRQFRVSVENLSVEEITGTFLVGSELAESVGGLLKAARKLREAKQEVRRVAQ